MAETLGLKQTERGFNLPYWRDDIPTAATLHYHKEGWGAKPVMNHRHQALEFGERIDRINTPATFAIAAEAVFTAKAEEDGELKTVGAIEVFPEHMSFFDVLKVISYGDNNLHERASHGLSKRPVGIIELANGTLHTYAFNPDFSHLESSFYVETEQPSVAQLENRAKPVGELALAA